MKIRKNLHAIWVTFNGKLQDEVIQNLQTWKETLPKDWKLCFWCNVSDIDHQYLTYLDSFGVTVLDIQDIVTAAPATLKSKLEYLKENGQHNSFQNIKLYSDIMRMLLMSMQGSELFSGVYIDITGAMPTKETSSKLESLKLEHGFAFRVQGYGPAFDSNVSIFATASKLENNSPAKKLIGVYFARLANSPLYNLKETHNMTKCAVTNIFNLVQTDVSDRSKTKLFSDITVSTEAVDSGKLLELLPDQGDPELHFTLDLTAYENVPNVNVTKLNANSIVFPTPNFSIAQSCKVPIPFYSPSGCLPGSTLVTLSWPQNFIHRSINIDSAQICGRLPR